MQIGGMEETYLAAKPLFLSMGKNTIYCGGTGNGVVSLLLCLNYVLVGEAIFFPPFSNLLIYSSKKIISLYMCLARALYCLMKLIFSLVIFCGSEQYQTDAKTLQQDITFIFYILIVYYFTYIQHGET